MPGICGGAAAGNPHLMGGMKNFDTALSIFWSWGRVSLRFIVISRPSLPHIITIVEFETNDHGSDEEAMKR